MSEAELEPTTEAAPEDGEEASPPRPRGSWKLALASYVIVFTASACGLSIEIVAGRILAPTIGVSLYTWTSIIGIVLAGISVGNFVGGVAADRFPRRPFLGLVLLASGVSSLGILPLIDVTSNALDGLPIVPRIVLLTTVLFFPPSVILGMVTPIVVKLRLRSLAKTGNIVGTTYAVSTAGSIFGTFITGFVLIQWIGTRSIIVAAAAVLLLLAVAFGRLWEVRIASGVLTALLVAVAVLTVRMDVLHSVCLVESGYFCIRVTEREEAGRTVSVLTLDKLVHSYVDVSDPTFLVYGYEKVLGDLSTYAGTKDPRFRSLFIGGGGYTMPRFIEDRFPESVVEVVEIDPEVTEVVHKYLGMPRDTRIVTYNEDARTKFLELPEGQYDLIVGDAFDHFSVPYHLTTLEFNERVDELLRDGGLYTLNVVDKLHRGRFLRAVVYTLQQTFDHVYVMRDSDRWDADLRHTFVVAASNEAIPFAEVAEANARAGRGRLALHVMPPGVFRDWIAAKENILLTDDFVPVDNLLAPLFVEDG